MNDAADAPLYTMIKGAGSPLGDHLAVRLSASRKLALSDRPGVPIENVREHCRRPSEHRLWFQDLGRPDALGESLRRWMADPPARIEALVYAAGVFRPGPLRMLDHQEGRTVMDVGFLSAAELCRQLLSRRVNGEALRQIVFISSVAAIRGVRGFSYYAAAKAALNGFMRSLAVEFAPRVRVNSVLPGAIDTEKADPAMLADARESHPLGLGRMDDVTGAVAFLLSDEARWITGHSLVVDGGWSC